MYPLRYIDGLIPPVAFLLAGLVFAGGAFVLLRLATLDLHGPRGRIPVSATLVTPAQVELTGRTGSKRVALEYSYATPSGTKRGSQYKQGVAFLSRSAAQTHADRLNAGGPEITVWVNRSDYSEPIVFLGLTAEDSMAALLGVPVGFAGFGLLWTAAASVRRRWSPDGLSCVLIKRFPDSIVLIPRHSPLPLFCFIVSLPVSIVAAIAVYSCLGDGSGAQVSPSAPRLAALTIGVLSIPVGLYARSCWLCPVVSATVNVEGCLLKRRSRLCKIVYDHLPSSDVQATTRATRWRPDGVLELVTDRGARHVLATDEPELMELAADEVNRAIRKFRGTPHA